jgi:SAM-dependent methyltransferase
MKDHLVQDFCTQLRTAIESHTFVKLTLSKPNASALALQNVYLRMVHLKGEEKLSFTFRYATNDQVKNFAVEEGLDKVSNFLESTFSSASLFTTQADHVFLRSKKGKETLMAHKATFTEEVSEHHDREKKKRVVDNDAYLQLLGITDEAGLVIPKMSDKYKQINKYLEIIDALIRDASLPAQVNIVDMGSGKGYLTFALYDYLRNTLHMDVRVTGIELRKELVAHCQNIAQRCGFDHLYFADQRIEAFNDQSIDILIALHACDTATDDAIYKGFLANSSLIICAPCCHKQIRQQVKGKEQQSPLLKYGIFKERQFEMVTDTIRAMIMEKHDYDTKIFEFISNEHTRKNIMLVGTKSTKQKDHTSIDRSIAEVKQTYGIDFHYLEKLDEK